MCFNFVIEENTLRLNVESHNAFVERHDTDLVENKLIVPVFAARRSYICRRIRVGRKDGRAETL